MKEILTKPKLLIPSGELEKRITPFFEEAGIRSSRTSIRSLQSSTNMGVTFVQVRASDIPNVLRLGLPDVIGGIAGSDSFLEQTGEVYPGIEVPVYPDRRPRIAIAATKEFLEEQGGTASLTDLAGKMITTTLPNMTRSAFEQIGMGTVTFPASEENAHAVTIFPVGGKTEALPLMSSSCPAVLDVVDSGGTLVANGLEVIKDLHEVSVRLVVASGITNENLEIFTRFQEMITQVY